ncbi:hypothetical protein MNEG_13681 [Monoraphidium neglectum]|uniref:Uncharacterized protein n=1 Tax=Monoraphidium neglectum TaxID=145388 RepID=A0A0D2MGW3_9CHLO|nr:hypothetical protein MNEG_13681 [Monoraphidium neglectum]KIY94280.1 hypothetical protein MNEG_13681 [Monoraphidium neglectum]|eukprot:XP_013893300.1 hypothetical protein MNEG_13681 [Monoraphidium neglectum]
MVAFADRVHALHGPVPLHTHVICDHYTVPKTASSEVMEYSRFLDDVDVVFTKKHLEKTPLEDVPAEPSELLDRNRYQRSSRRALAACLVDIGEAKEARLGEVMARISNTCDKRGILLKPFFDDAAADDHSAKLYGHVTAPQFKQVLNVKVGIRVSDSEAQLLAEKFHHEDLTELVNYIAFSAMVDPHLGAFEEMVQ